MYNTDLPTRAELPSTGRLLKSTAVALLIAIILLITVILPAEYGIDPTGIGAALGLARMGEIKVALAAEANSVETSAAAAPAVILVAAVPAATPPAPPAAVEPTPVTRQHTQSFTLKPGQAAEIKLDMKKDAVVKYAWASAGGVVNFDAHGDPRNAPKDFYHGYGKGRGAAEDAGELRAAFDGSHGWFWRNRSETTVTITLTTDGAYEAIKRVL
jgi:hypothetical protein